MQGKSDQLGQFQNVPFRSLRLSVRYLRQAQILILEILHVFLWLKYSPSLISNKIEYFETASVRFIFISIHLADFQKEIMNLCIYNDKKKPQLSG